MLQHQKVHQFAASNNTDSQEKMLSVSGKKKCSHCGDELGKLNFFSLSPFPFSFDRKFNRKYVRCRKRSSYDYWESTIILSHGMFQVLCLPRQTRWWSYGNGRTSTKPQATLPQLLFQWRWYEPQKFVKFTFPAISEFVLEKSCHFSKVICPRNLCVFIRKKNIIKKKIRLFIIFIDCNKQNKQILFPGVKFSCV